MTIPPSDLLDNHALALRLVLENLPTDRPYAWEVIEGDTVAFSSILPTTWKALEDQGLIKRLPFNRCRLTPSGWIEALKATGRFHSPALTEDLKKLMPPLKRRVKGRQSPSSVTRAQLALESELPESFVYNAIDSELVLHLFKCVPALWAPEDQMCNVIDIPIDFGMPISSYVSDNDAWSSTSET